LSHQPCRLLPPYSVVASAKRAQDTLCPCACHTQPSARVPLMEVEQRERGACEHTQTHLHHLLLLANPLLLLANELQVLHVKKGYRKSKEAYGMFKETYQHSQVCTIVHTHTHIHTCAVWARISSSFSLLQKFSQNQLHSTCPQQIQLNGWFWHFVG
jgi:hypothetical protein